MEWLSGAWDRKSSVESLTWQELSLAIFQWTGKEGARETDSPNSFSSLCSPAGNFLSCNFTEFISFFELTVR